MKKILCILMAACTLFALTACGAEEPAVLKQEVVEVPVAAEKPIDGQVVCLICAEDATEWETMAVKYTEETRVPVTIKVVAPETYLEELTTALTEVSELTLFALPGAYDATDLKDYCYDIAETYVYSAEAKVEEEPVESSAEPGEATPEPTPTPTPAPTDTPTPEGEEATTEEAVVYDYTQCILAVNAKAGKYDLAQTLSFLQWVIEENKEIPETTPEASPEENGEGETLEETEASASPVA